MTHQGFFTEIYNQKTDENLPLPELTEDNAPHYPEKGHPAIYRPDPNIKSVTAAAQTYDIEGISDDEIMF